MALLAVDGGDSPRPSSRSNSAGLRKKGSWGMSIPTLLKANRTDHDEASCDFDLSPLDGGEAWKDLDRFVELGLTLDAEEDEYPVRMTESSLNDNDGDDDDDDDEEERYTVHEKEENIMVTPAKPFHKWMKTLQRRAQGPKIRSSNCLREPFPTFTDTTFSSSGNRKSSSESSFGYVASVKSASISVAGSVLTHSRRNTARSSHYARTDRSSRASISCGRHSEDCVRPERTVIDPAVTERLLQRRRILEELISTEESYIGDIKFLMNVYVTILASLPTHHPGLRSSINRNLTDIVELHEEILGELHRVVPNSEYTQVEQLPAVHKPPKKPAHQRWRSLDSVPENKRGTSWLQDIPGMAAEPGVAADVAHVFGARMHRFFVYEEYGAKYEMMIKDVASTHRTMPQWETYQKGLEALASSLGSVTHQLDHSRKSLTIGDLLVKPIQRICKYPLLFSELLRFTPVYDCPNSHSEIVNVLARLREATAEINRATDDPSAKVTIERSWLLQDRLVYPDQYPDASLKTAVRSFGQIRLCGALHVCWQTREGVGGQYMVCLLYKDCLCLATATASRAQQLYIIQACIALETVKIEEADNGRGLQCHTAPFSWKLVFEVNHQLYEIVMTACSLKEELEWRTRLAGSIPSELHDHTDHPFSTSLSLNIKSLGTIFGKPGTVARRLSIHRATTVGPKSPLCQVILKNTTTARDVSTANFGSTINRSQSLFTTSPRIPVLAPSRGERARLEAMLADVWSRTILPFPGITTRSKSEHLVRSSASTMMRKLSVASIASSFSRRSASHPSGNSNAVLNDEKHAHVDDFVGKLANLNCDFSSSSLNLEQEPTDAQRLPVICDEAERNSCSPSLHSVDAATVASTLVEKLGQAKVGVQGRPDGPLRCSSANSIVQSKGTLPSIESTSPELSEKENVRRKGQLAKQSSQETAGAATKHVRKWSKVSTINRGRMAGGIRSFFR